MTIFNKYISNSPNLEDIKLIELELHSPDVDVPEIPTEFTKQSF